LTPEQEAVVRALEARDAAVRRLNPQDMHLAFVRLRKACAAAGLHNDPERTADADVEFALRLRITALEAQIAERDEALQALGEFDRRVRRDLGEAVHIGLRKGTDSDQATKAWDAIRAIPSGDWALAINYAIYGLECGIETKLRRARQALGEKG
jgi:hypothetical protein